jgi:ATP-dependent Clp protease adaptor protein ClpS
MPKLIIGLRITLQKKEDMATGTKTLEETGVDVLTDFEKLFQIIVWNDEVNTFEWVIETLIEVCGHSEEQAEQCAMLIHTKGKYGVKNGSYADLKPQCDAITDRGIGATLEVMA